MKFNLMKRVCKFCKSILAGIIIAVFPSSPFSIKKTNLFDRDFLLYIDQDVGRKILLGIFETKETEFLLSQIRKDDVCLDIGANVGYYTFLFSSVAKQVFSIEPIRQNADLIRLSCSINRVNNISVICAAASSINDEIEFLESTETGYSSVKYIDHDASLINAYDTSFNCSYRVPAITIDSLCLDKLDIVKMDIEGYEYLALQGMTHTLKSVRPRILMIEMVESHLNRFGSGLHDVLTFLGECGYKPMILSGGKLANYKGQSIPNDNLFFIQKEKDSD